MIFSPFVVTTVFRLEGNLRQAVIYTDILSVLLNINLSDCIICYEFDTSSVVSDSLQSDPKISASTTHTASVDWLLWHWIGWKSNW